MSSLQTAFYLALEFFKTGLFTVGGGLAALPFLADISTRYGWYTQQQLTDFIAIAESTPGPIAINVATFAGYQVLGVPGAIIATFSLAMPSIIILTFISKFLSNFSENKTVKAAFNGIRPAVAGMIASALYSLMKVSLLLPGATASTFISFINIKCVLIFAVIFALMRIKKLNNLHPIFWLACAAISGIVLQA